MKLLIKLIALLIIFQSCNNEKALIEKSPWINVKTGEIFEIENDSLFITKYFWKHRKRFSYKLIENNITINDSLYGIIQSTNKDSMIIYDDSSFHQFARNIFIPIRPYKLNKRKENVIEIINKGVWEMDYNNTKYRFDFSSNKAMDTLYYQVFITETKNSISEIANLYWWTLKEYNDHFFIVISDYNFNFIRFFQLFYVTDSLIKADMNYFNLYKLEQPVVAMEINNLNTERNIKSIKGILKNSSWKLKDYEIIVKNRELFNGIESQFEPEEKEMPLPRIQSKIHGIKRIYEHDYLNKTVKYSFDQNMKGYLISNQDTLRRGNCKLSVDGKLMLAEPYTFFPNAKIIEINEDLFIIEKTVMVNFGDDKNYEKWYTREVFEKE